MAINREQIEQLNGFMKEVASEDDGARAFIDLTATHQDVHLNMQRRRRSEVTDSMSINDKVDRLTATLVSMGRSRRARIKGIAEIMVTHLDTFVRATVDTKVIPVPAS